MGRGHEAGSRRGPGKGLGAKGEEDARAESSGSLVEICELPGPEADAGGEGRGGREGLFGALGDLGTPEGRCAEGRRVEAE